MDDPISLFRFGVEIGSIVSGWFTECSGLAMEREVVEVKEGGVNGFTHKLPGPAKYPNVTLKRGIAGDELWKWLNDQVEKGKIKKMNISILLFNGDRTQVKRWNLAGAYPIKWKGPDFKTNSTEVAIETVELVHHGLEVMGWSGALFLK